MSRLSKCLVAAVVFIVWLDIAALWYLNHGLEPSALFQYMEGSRSDESNLASSGSESYDSGAKSYLQRELASGSDSGA